MAVGIQSTRALAGLILLLATGSACAQGLPVANGTPECSTLTYSNHRLVVTQGLPNCVINWESFDIGAGNVVEFMQPESWRLLNHVSADAFTTIAGTLRATGTIYIVNPAGVFFTGSSVVDVGGLYAAGAALDSDDFRAGIDRFVTPSGVVINEGSITGDAVHLLGSRIANHGTIVSDRGVVTMVAGADEILLSDDGGRVSVRVDGIDLTSDLAVSPGGVPPTLTGTAGVENSGTVDAVGGQITLGVGDVYALAIRNSGRLHAAGGSTQLAALGGTVTHGGADATLSTGTLSVTGDVIHLESDVQADAAHFNDPVIIGADLLIEGETPDTDADEVIFRSTVDSSAVANDLEVNARHTEFSGDVGASARLATIEVSGTTGIARNLYATEAIRLGGDAEFTENGAQVLDAGAGTIRAGGALGKTTSNSLTLRADSGVEIAGDVNIDLGRFLVETTFLSAAGDLTSGNGEVRINGAADVAGSISAGTGVVVTGPARIGGNVDALADVRFGDIATVLGDVSAVDDVRFERDAVVGGSVAAGADVDFFGAALVVGDIAAGDDVTFFDDANVGGAVTAAQDVDFLGRADVNGIVNAGDDATFASFARVGGVAAGDDVVFLGEAIVRGDIAAGGDAEFFGHFDVQGDVAALDDAEFFAAGTIGGSVITGDNARFYEAIIVDGDVLADGDATFYDVARIGGDVMAGDDVDFMAAAEVDGNVDAIDDVTFFANAIVGGNASAGDDVRFRADAVVRGDVRAVGDIEFAGSAQVDGLASAGDDVVFAGPATLGGDVFAFDRITFNDVTTLTGRGDQRIEAGGALRANGNLIKTTDGALVLASRELIILNGDLVQAVGDVRLAPEGRVSVPSVATISSNGDLSIVSLTGDVTMGANEKLTVLGTLRLSAAGELVLSDITTLDDLIATAPSIRLRPRASGLVLDDDGFLTLDAGVDFVAGGRFFFSVSPTLLDGSSASVLFASARADADALGTLSRFRPRVTTPLRRSLLRRDGVVLDMRADGAPIAELATAFTRDLAAFAPTTSDIAPVSAALASRLRDLGLRVRPLTPAEEAEMHDGRIVYDNLRATGRPPVDDRTVAIGRLDLDAVARGLAGYDAIDAEATRTSLARAWSRYAALTDEPGGTDFRVWLESLPDAPPALAHLDGLRELLRDVLLMGATDTDVQLVARRLARTLTPDGISRADLLAAIGSVTTG